MKNKENKGLKKRIIFLLVLFLLVLAGLSAKAFHLQILDPGRLQEKAARQIRKTTSILSERGEIFDRNSNELAISMEVVSVFAHTKDIKDPKRVAAIVAPILDVGRRTIEKKLKRKNRFVWLKRQVDLMDKDKYILKDIKGVGSLKEAKRFYPTPQLASNVIGFVGYDSVGLEGVEWSYNKYLKGEDIKLANMRDALGREIASEDTKKVALSQGNDLVLTIDRTIQYITEKELKKAVKKAEAKAGIAIVMNPLTGEILAMTSLPTFDPNHYYRYRPGDWRNRAITDTYEPGSTFKIFLAAAAIEEGVVDPLDIFYCENGKYRIADRVFHDSKKHGWLSVKDIIKYSSNIGVIKIAEKLSKEKQYRYIKDFGFGEKTGIDLPGEVSGYVMDIDDWSKVTAATTAFGQGISTTAVQLVTAVSAIANKGVLMEPRIIKRIVAANGGVVKEFHPVVSKRVVSQETALKVTNILKGVTMKGGTGERASVPFVEVAGKTGTAQKPDPVNRGYEPGKYVSSFLGFAPADSPKLAIIVMVDEPENDYYGSAVAAPVFREILRQSMAYLDIMPFKEGNTFKPLPIKEVSISNNYIVDGKMPDFRGKSIRAVLRMAGRIPLDVKVVGSGKAVSQRVLPAKGAGYTKEVEVRFQ